jgi:TonB family protein
MVGILLLTPMEGLAHVVGPVTPCPEGTKLCEPVVEEKRLPKRWGFWSECESFVGAPTVRFLVTADGRTSEHHILRSSGCDGADRELLCWMRQWKYQPATCDGNPIPYRTTFSINWHPHSDAEQVEACAEQKPVSDEISQAPAVRAVLDRPEVEDLIGRIEQAAGQRGFSIQLAVSGDGEELSRCAVQGLDPRPDQVDELQQQLCEVIGEALPSAELSGLETSVNVGRPLVH